MSDLDPLVSPKTKVLRMLRQGIDSGTLAPGDPVPSEKTLADHLGVTRSAVRAAFDQLEADGVVRIHGKGRIVADYAGGRNQSIPTVLIVGGHTGPQPYYHRSTHWAIHAQRRLEERLRRAGYIGKALPAAAVAGDFERAAHDRPVAMVVMCDGGMDPATAQALEGLGTVPRIHYASALDDPASQGTDTVAVDHAAGGAALVDWLVAQGRGQLQRVWFCLLYTSDAADDM
jgi:hypothetical protein